jgi:hypothetical protein
MSARRRWRSVSFNRSSTMGQGSPGSLLGWRPSRKCVEHLLAVENELNARPRIVLNDRPPEELFNALLGS